MDRFSRDPLLPDERGENTLLRHVRRPAPSFEGLAILVLAVLAALMLGVSQFNQTTDTGPLANFKAVLITLSASWAVYGVNRFAIEKLAPLAAIGFWLAAVIAVVGMLSGGGGMFASTFTGLVLKDVAHIQLQDHGSGLSNAIGDRNAGSLKAATVGPAVRIAVADIRGYVACEIATSCLSGRADGGRGTVAVALEGLATKAAAIAAQFEVGQTSAQQILAAANSLIGDYQKVLGRGDIDVWQKQAELLKIHGRIEQQAGALAEAIPVRLLRAYAAELAKGITIADRPEATQRINAVLIKHAETLSAILPELERTDRALPTFPGRPGVAQTLAYIPHFASIAAIVFVSELLLPLTLWVSTYLRLAWAIEKAENDRRGPPPPNGPSGPPSRPALPAEKHDEFDGLIKLPSPAGNNPRPRHRRRHHHRRPS